MDGDSGLVGYLVDRLATKLPHRIGVSGAQLDDDEVLQTTRATLIKLSRTTINIVLSSLLDLLEDVSAPYKAGISRHPISVLQSEAYIIELAAACCSARWEAIRVKAVRGGESEQIKDVLVKHIFDLFKGLLEPIPEDYVLPARTLLDHTAGLDMEAMRAGVAVVGSGARGETGQSVTSLTTAIERHAKAIVEFVTAVSWATSFTYLRSAIHSIRTAVVADMSSDVTKLPLEKGPLVILRLLSYCWVDSAKLGLLIQEICSSYLHFRKPYQNTVAAAMPLLITRWIDRYPQEFVELHRLHKRLDGGSETLFDMTQTSAENGRRRTSLYPLQTSLLFLMPDVFEVASNLREAKGASIAKKVSFLDSLRKALRNGNDQAGYCLVSLLRVARHFDAESDSALVSFALDVQDEVRDAIFRPKPANQSGPAFDQDMVTAAFVSLAHLNLESCLETLVSYCVSSKAPASFKIALVEACCYFASLPSESRYNELFQQTRPFMKTHIQGLVHSSLRENPDAATPPELTCHILRFLRISLDTVKDDLETARDDSYLVHGVLLCALSRDIAVRKQAIEVTEAFFVKYPLAGQEPDSSMQETGLRRNLWKLSSAVIEELCHKLQSNAPQLSSLHAYLKNRLFLLRKIPGLAQIPENVAEVAEANEKLEMSLFVALCSADVEDCQLAAASIGLLLEECQLVQSCTDNDKAYASVQRNLAILGEISSPSYRITGLVAFQKRARLLFRKLPYPTVGIGKAWRLAFDTWVHLAKEVSTMSSDSTEEKVMSEWRNLSGFLASLGGVCISEQAVGLDYSTVHGIKWIDIPDMEHPEDAPLARFLRLGVQLLACSNIRVREAMRDTFSHETSPQLNQDLFKAVEAEVEILLTGALAPNEKSHDSEVIFAEQAVSLLKDMVEKLGTAQGSTTTSTVHLGALSLNFAKFVEGTVDTALSLRVKVRICQLVEAVMRRKEHLNLRDDVRIRNQLLEFIFAWIERPETSLKEQSSSRLDETWRIQKDLDKACLKTLADLTLRLPLQPADSQTDASMSEMKSQMFQTYFNRFLSLLNHESVSDGMVDKLQNSSSPRNEALSNADLAIAILSNLLSANIDVGLKHSLNIGYHESIAIRTAFIRVLYNILSQGTEFSHLSDSAVTEKYDELLELLTKDLSLAVAMSSICPGAEIDELAVCLLTVFEQRGLTFDLFEALIKEEIDQTENETEILRRNSVATKMLSLYAKWKGYSYLHGTLHKVLDRLLLTSHDLDLELDPTRVSDPEELRKNAMQLQVVSKVFMDDICASAASIPASFRKICNIIYEAVMPRFPNAKYTAIGAFIFLRFFCPAIVAPEAEGLVSSPPTKEMRRGLLLIAKIIQNLANNVLFGTKEPYMFPLNQFLVENISVAVSFLHEISIPPDDLPTSVSRETFDFGSCVSFHRFLYDHWDHLQQTLTSRERRDYIRSPDSFVRSRSPVLEPLRSLIANLGPSPLAISWNRPQISTNGPPLYARFQNFMLKNAFKSTESFLASQAVYDGGETKDGLSIVNVILRHIENEGIDYETLLYCYLKIASRLWHEPFVVFVDATCYAGKTEPRDDFFKMLDLLAPFELSQNLCRIYIYNMNSAFKRCFRRLLRISTKNEYSVFHPNNVEYYLPSNFDDLKIHFNLADMCLPKDTVTVMSDGRYIFQPVARLSKSKGRVEVAIRVGTQFLQITTTKKQEILSGLRLSTVINDVFRLVDVEEASTTMQPEDESSFGIRADSGKIVMCFSSPKRSEVLHAIRNAKGKQGKDNRMPKHLERLIRPQDVPGTLLNLAFANLLSMDRGLRLASYNLLGALGRAFQFETSTRLVCAKDLAVPMDPSRFLVNISTQLAHSEPQLTSDFLTEFFVSWETFPDEQKAFSLAYMAPWLSGLRTNVLVGESDGEKGRDKVAAIFAKFIDLIALDQTLAFALEQSVWPLIVQDELLMEIFLEELVKTTLAFGSQYDAIEAVASVIANISSLTVRARFLARLRKALNRSSLRPTRQLPDNAVWGEICTMLHVSVALSFDCSIQSQLFLPEVFHVVTILSNTGTRYIQRLVDRLLANTVHAICASFPLDESKLQKVRASLELLAEPKGHFLASSMRFSRESGQAPVSTEAGSTLAATENLVNILYEITGHAAISVDVSNAWRSRWMSLVASTAFQNNPAIQPRAFAVMGYLARQDVDDDLLYQVLVALRNSISQFGEDGNSEMLIAIITCLSRMISNLPSASRYGLQLFWLAMSLIRLVPATLFNCTAQFLEAILVNIGSAGNARGDGMVTMLLQSRGQLDDAAQLLDDAYGIHFDSDNFHFAVCACLVRGLTNSSTRFTAIRVLCAFLEMTTAQAGLNVRSSDTLMASPYLSLAIARSADFEDLRDSIWSTGMDPDEIKTMLGASGRPEGAGMEDRHFLLVSAIELVDFQHLEDTAQSQSLLWLNELAQARPSVFIHLCGIMPSILNDVLIHGQDSAALEAAHTLVRTLTSEERYSKAIGSMDALNEELEDLGFPGLWTASFHQPLRNKKECFQLTEKLIELIVI